MEPTTGRYNMHKELFHFSKTIKNFAMAVFCSIVFAVSLSTTANAETGKINYIEGKGFHENDYHKYPDSCSVRAIQGVGNDTRYGISFFCGDTGQFSRYLFQYTNSYGENYRLERPVGVYWFQSVSVLPGDDFFIQTDLVITPIL